MRKTIALACLGLVPLSLFGQDSLKTTTLKEVVVTGTKFALPVEKSGKTIYKLDSANLEKNAGKTLADLLNEVPGIQTDGNFGTPGSNLSYYVRGGRNKQTLILIDGVPLNDPSAINAEYDLRYIPLSQIESVEILKGGLSTLYGTSAAAGVINIRLKKPAGKFSALADVSAGSFATYSENIQLSGTSGKFSYFLSGNNVTSKGFSSAEDNDPNIEFDDDSFSRRNGLLKMGYKFNNKFSMLLHTAYEQFDADYDAYEFADEPFTQSYHQFRVGIHPEFVYEKGEVEMKIFFNENEREFASDFPSTLNGRNWQGEIIHRHHFSDNVQTLAGVDFQHESFEEVGSVSADTAHFTLLDPYISLLIDLPIGLNLHAGARLNTHNLYGSNFIYNINPSFLFKKNGTWQYKALASVSTSFITPTLYQLYSVYGNTRLKPERSLNYEAGISVYKDGLAINAVWFKRNDENPIDFVSLFDMDGNYTGGQYRNLSDERMVKGIELDAEYEMNRWLSVQANYTYMDTDKPESFYKIPNTKYGLSIQVQPTTDASLSVKYNYTGARTTFDFSSYAEIALRHYRLVDVYASYRMMKNSLTLYGAINNIMNEQFVAVYGYTTRGRNFNVGLRYRLGS